MLSHQTLGVHRVYVDSTCAGLLWPCACHLKAFPIFFFSLCKFKILTHCKCHPAFYGVGFNVIISYRSNERFFSGIFNLNVPLLFKLGSTLTMLFKNAIKMKLLLLSIHFLPPIWDQFVGTAPQQRRLDFSHPSHLLPAHPGRMLRPSQARQVLSLPTAGHVRTASLRGMQEASWSDA